MKNLNQTVQQPTQGEGYWNDRTRKIWWRRGVIALFIILLFLACCDRKVRKNLKDANQTITNLTEVIDSLKGELNYSAYQYVVLQIEKENLEVENSEKDEIIDSLKNLVNHWQNQKPIVLVTKHIKPSEGREITIVEARIVPKSSKYPSHVTIECSIEDSAQEKVPCVVTEEDCQEYIEAYTESPRDSLNQIKNDSIVVVMAKTTPDSTSEVSRRAVEYYSLINAPIDESPNPIATHTLAEYTAMACYYRQKAENSFWNGVISGGGAAVLYGVTEAMGHPIFRDVPPYNNSAAEMKSITIKGLRVVSGVWAGLSIIEFIRAWYFHNMEAKFIVYPTELGVSLTIPQIK
jgi:hypothetical protein